MLLLVLGAPPALAIDNALYNDLNGVTLGDTPYSSAAPFDSDLSGAPINYDASAFSITDSERSHAVSILACGVDANVANWGAKTGWVRFATAVAGRLNITVDTSYDVLYYVYAVPLSTPAGTATVTDLAPHQVNCLDARTSGGEDLAVNDAIPAGQTIYVETAAWCAGPIAGPTYPCSTADEANVPAGQTHVIFRFTPDNQDHDAVPDTLDRCPTAAGPIGGCPDSDGDGVADVDDQCRTVPGHAANGCRLPDEDGDGYRVDGASASTRDCNDDNAAIHPGAVEILGNDVDENCDGFAAFDRDNDGYVDAPAGPDCDPTRASVHPGAVDVPGNALDEDCSGSALPYPRVTNRIAPLYGLYRDGVLRPLEFDVLDVVAGLRIEVDCRGRGCPFGVKVQNVRKPAAKRKLRGLSGAHKLRVGAQFAIRLTRPGHIGKIVRYTIRSKRRKPAITTRCLAVGSTSLQLKTC